MKRDPFAERVASLIQASCKSHEQIAVELGFARPAIIAAFTSGLVKVPIAKTPALAIAVGAEPAHLLREALGAYAPDLLIALESCVGRLVPERVPLTSS
jgi:hypothetical protein